MFDAHSVGHTDKGQCVFLAPLSLQNVSQLRHPSERVPVGEQREFAEGLELIADGAFEGYEMQSTVSGAMQLKVFLDDRKEDVKCSVKILQDETSGVLDFRCDNCGTRGDTKITCSHQFASYVVLWQALTLEEDVPADPRIEKLSEELRGPRNRNRLNPSADGDASGFLTSVTLYVEEAPVLRGETLSSLLAETAQPYRLLDVSKEQESLAPTLWNLPDVFRRKLTAYSENYFNEVNEQNRIAGMVRYNFSNGVQVSAKDILRHPLYKSVPKDLLPQPRKPESAFNRWPLTLQRDNLFISQGLRDVEEIMQVVLSNIATKVNQGQLEVYIQGKNSQKTLPVRLIDFDMTREFEWRVDFVEKADLISQFALTSPERKKPFSFYESFAFEAEEGVLAVHPWYREWSQFVQVLTDVKGDALSFTLSATEYPRIEIEGELEAKRMVKHLRTRTIPVHITGETKVLEASQSVMGIYLTENGSFHLQHEARVMGQKDLARTGWTARASLYLHVLSEGLPYFLGTDAKEVATRARGKRDWDLKLLRHLGVLQYLTLETLNWHFAGELTDGRIVEEDEIFKLLQENIQSILVSGTGVVLARDMTLQELCSRNVLVYFDDYVSKTIQALKSSESFYSESGEVILEGAVEREFRLIYEMLKRLVATTNGDAFRKSRTSFLAKVWNGDPEKDVTLRTGLFHFPNVRKESSHTHDTIESLQALLPFGFKIYYKGQALQELNEDDFQVDFLLTSDAAEKYFNWFELNPKFFLKGQEIDANAMSGFGGGGVIEYDGKLYLVPKKQMPSLRRLENFWKKLQGHKSDSKVKGGIGERVYKLPRHQILELLALRASGVAIRGDHEWKKICDFYDGLGQGPRPVTIPKTVKAELKQYQEYGVQWLQDLYNLRLGALLADDMGLGKTLQTLTFLEDLRTKEELGQVLIVVPSSLIFNWQSEVQKFTPDIPLEVFTNKDRDRLGKKLFTKQDCVLITTYGLLMEHEDFLSQVHWKTLIFDEAQNLKNITTKRTSAARSLNAQFKICLTGTPMENHYGEFYSLVDILVPGSLGKIEDFRRQFVNTEMVTREEMDDLKLKIKPLLLRRTKKEILDQLPEKQETKMSIAFEDQQMEIYRDIALSYNQKVQEAMTTNGEASVQLQMLTALLRLRQACSDPAGLPNVRYEKVPPKLETLLESISEIVESGESALVFTQFLQTLERTAKLLHEAGVPVFVLHGGIPTAQRQKILAEFNNTNGGAVLVMTLKTGGVGLNLTKASYVFHLEPWWNPSVENQATDRAHRLGQNKAVQVFRYIMHESLEEKIEVLKTRKGVKFQNLFGNAETTTDIGGNASGALSKEDFDILLGLKS
jgi:superfamily II DNA or RNA helicase